jgi:hypothetical protein
VLIAASAALAPLVIRDLEARKLRYFYPSDEAHAVGYDAVCKAQEAMLMDIGTQLILEIRAARGVDELDLNYKDPTADPFTLRMGHLEKLSTGLDDVSGKLQTIIDSLANQQSPEELADILQTLGTIAAALA